MGETGLQPEIQELFLTLLACQLGENWFHAYNESSFDFQFSLPLNLLDVTLLSVTLCDIKRDY